MAKVFSGWWQVVVALVIQGVSAASIFTGYSVVVAPFKLEFGPSNMVLMLGMTLTSLISGLLSPSIGAALDRFSIRKMMLVGVGLVMLGFCLMSVSTSMFQVLLVYGVFMSVGSLLLGPIATSALLARWFTRRRGLAMGIAACGSAVGGLLLPPLLQIMIDSFEWRIALRIFSVVIFILTVPLIVFLVVDRPTPEQHSQDAIAGSHGSVATEPQEIPGSVFKDRNFWYIALVIGSLFCGPMALMSNMMPFALGRGVDAVNAAFLISIYSGAGLAGKLICASVVDRINQRLGLGVILCLVIVGMMGFIQANSYSLLSVACLIVGMASGTASLFWSVILAQVYGPNKVGQMMGKMNLVIMPLTLLSPPLFGWVSDITGSYVNAFIGYIGLLVLALMLLTQMQLGQSQASRLQTASE
ncbi:MFS transporter [Pseudomaricurvus sp.]|uniref:MFS transporter n=1 Tax=Pseudomaricurvus sp. TaxID=2004510 RepID=UPI003F6B35A5